MLGDVVAAALEVGPVLVVTDDATAVPPSAQHVRDPGAGLGAAVVAGLAEVDGHALVVNADLPAATPQAIEELASAGLALVEAADGTTNALSLPDAVDSLPCTGREARARFREQRAVRDRTDPGARGGRRHARRSRAARGTPRSSHARSPRSSGVKVALLSGGVGGARFARGLQDVLEPGELTVIGNVGDDVEVLGLHVSPDLDSHPLHALRARRRGARAGVVPARAGRRSRQPVPGEARTGSGSAISTWASTSCARARCAMERRCRR